MNKTKIAALLAGIIGAMAILAGGQVIFLGKVMDYYVIDWLPVYNFGIGVLSLILTSVLIWKQSAYAQKAALATFGFHAAVMLILQIIYKNVVAPDSIRAMSIRLAVWAIILALMFLDARDKKTNT